MKILAESGAIRSHLDKVLKRLDPLAVREPVRYKSFGKELTVPEIVDEILARVRRDGDKAVAELQFMIDGAKLDPARLTVSEEEFNEAEQSISADIKESLALMAERITIYARQMMPHTEVWFPVQNGRKLGYRFTAIENLGAYVPGGLAGSTPLISTVLMNLLPAKVAGVENIVVSTPCRKDGSIHPILLHACKLAGATTVYRCGGAQGIAAMAFGTASLPRCNKIIGPGNAFVQEAKRKVYGAVDIDMMAGPSEIAIIADSSMEPAVLAADLIAQAEHDPAAASILFACDDQLLTAVKAEVELQLASLPRSSIANASLQNFGALCKCKDLAEACAYVNELAPEHLELACKNPSSLLGKIRHAGAIFLGPHTPEVIGDYTAGPSHTLPTCGAARFSSGITVFSFLKSSSLIEYDLQAMNDDMKPLTRMARAENLEGHARSLLSRIDKSTTGNTP